MQYERIAPRERGLLGFSEIYLAEDHVMELRSFRVMEEYRRFRFEDIYAIQVTKTADFATWAMAVSVLSLFSLFAVYLIPNWWARIVLWMPPLFGLLYSIYVAMQGPRCLTRLFTKSGVVELRSLSSLRNAEMALPLLEQRLLASQTFVSDVPMEAPPSWSDPRKAIAKRTSGFWIAIGCASLLHAFTSVFEKATKSALLDFWSISLSLGITALIVCFLLWRRIEKALQEQTGLMLAAVGWPLLLVEVLVHCGFLGWRLFAWTGTLGANSQEVEGIARAAAAKDAYAWYGIYNYFQAGIYAVIAIGALFGYLRARKQEQQQNLYPTANTADSSSMQGFAGNGFGYGGAVGNGPGNASAPAGSAANPWPQQPSFAEAPNWQANAFEPGTPSSSPLPSASSGPASMGPGEGAAPNWPTPQQPVSQPQQPEWPHQSSQGPNQP